MNDISSKKLTVEADTASDVGDALQRTAMLAACTISKWSATVSDTSAVTDIKKARGAVGDVGKFMKNLLAGADAEYKALNSALDDARACHYRLTLPWVAHDGIQRGPRLLPNTGFEKYLREMGVHKERIQTAKDAFEKAYPEAAKKAMQNLGQLASSSSYPSVQRVMDSFGMRLDFTPIPSGSGFKNLPDNMMFALNQNLNKRARTMIDNAMKDVWAQLRDKVSKFIERLEPVTEGKPKIFHNSMITGAREFLDLMGSFNIAGDPKLVEVEQDLRAMVASLDPEQLRNSEGLKAETREKAAALKSKLDQWGV